MQGMSPALVRQVAHYRGQGDLAAGRGPAGRLLRSFELLLLPIALLACLTIYGQRLDRRDTVAGTRAEHRDHHELHQPDGADDRPRAFTRRCTRAACRAWNCTAG